MEKNMKKWSMFLCLFVLLTSCDENPSASNSNSGSSASASASTSASVSTSTSASSSVVDDKNIIAEKVALGVQNKGKVKSGVVTEKDLMDEEMEPSVYNYEFGEAAFTYSGEGEFASTSVFFLDSNDEVFGVEEFDGELSKPYEFGPDNMEGYPFEGIISFDYETSYGVEALVSDFFAEASTNSNNDAKFVVNNDDFEFSFGIKADSESFVMVKVNFTLSAENAFKTVVVQADTYASENFVDDIELGTVTLKEDAVMDYSMSYSIEQVEGSRTYVSPYHEDDFYFTSFDLTFEENVVTDATEVTVDAGSDVSIYIENAMPETASLSFDELNIEVTKGDASGIDAMCRAFNNSIMISAYTIGDYEITIQSKNVTKVVKVKVSEPALQDLTIYHCVPNGSEGNYMYDTFTSGQTVYCTKTLVLTAVPNPDSADGSYEATLLNPTEGVTFSSVEVENMMGDVIKAYSFTSTVVGTFNIRFTSTVDAAITKDVSVNVAEIPDVKDIVKGVYVYHSSLKGTEFEFEFTPDATGMSGSLVMKDFYANKTETLSYTINESDLVLTHVSGDTIIVATSSLTINDKYQLVFSYLVSQFGDTYERQEILERKTPSVMIIGTYSAVIDELTYQISFNKGSAFMNYHNDDWSIFESVELKYSIAEEAGANGFAITWISKNDEAFTAIDVTNTDSYLSSDFQELHISVVHNGNSQLVLFSLDAE